MADQALRWLEKGSSPASPGPNDGNSDDEAATAPALRVVCRSETAESRPDIVDQRNRRALSDVSWAWNRIFSDYEERPAVYTDPRQPDNPIEYATLAFCALTGYEPEEVVGQDCLFLRGPDTDARSVATVLAALAKWRPATVDILNYRKDGTPFWDRMSLKPVFGSGNIVDRWIVVHSFIAG